MTGIRAEGRTARTKRTATWRRVNFMDVPRNVTGEPGDRGLLSLRVARDFADIMRGYSDRSDGGGSYALDRFMDSLFTNSHWR